jgi:hypothetical protein
MRADKDGNDKMTFHHQLKRSTISEINNSVSKFALLIEERRNPYI